MKHSLTCLMWRWRRQAAAVETKLGMMAPRQSTWPAPAVRSYSERGIGEGQGYARALRECALAVERSLTRAEKEGT